MASPPDDFLRWQVGEARITRVLECIDDSDVMSFVLPQATPEALSTIPWLAPHFVNEKGALILSIHALVIETADRRILVDTCLGNDKERSLPSWNRRDGPFLRDLERAGYPPESIDTVLCTHLHVDHVGWNTRWDGERWIPTFPNARYLIARTEWEHWDQNPEAEGVGPVLTDSVRPIFEAGLADLVETNHRVSDEVELAPTPGHTPGHVSVWVRSNAEQAVITGDMIHHPCQIAHTDWASAVDSDAEQGTKSREQLLATCADQPILVIGTHFATPTAGHVVRDDGRYRLSTAER